VIKDFKVLSQLSLSSSSNNWKNVYTAINPFIKACEDERKAEKRKASGGANDLGGERQGIFFLARHFISHAILNFFPPLALAFLAWQ
jgi:hypothetical protein